MTSEVVRYEIKNFITWTSTWKIDLKNPGWSVRNERHTTGFLRKRFYKSGSSVRGRQVPLVEVDEDPGPQTSDLQRLTMRDLKKRKN